MTVERCVSDSILVDDALNESMFNLSSKIQENEEKSDDQETMKRRQETTAEPLNEAITEEGKLNYSTKTKTKETQSHIDLEMDLDSLGNSGHITTVQNEKNATELRRSQRVRKQRMTIDPSQIGDCDDPKDLDYN